MEIIHLKEDYIKLGQALKAAGLVESGVDAKFAVQDGLVKVNGSDTSSGAVSNFVNVLSNKFSGTVYSNAYQKLYVLGTSKDGKIDWENMNASEFQLYLGSSEKKIFQFQIEKTKDNGSTI